MSTHELQKVRGIGPKYAEALVNGGVTDLKTLAASSPEALEAVVQAPAWRADYADWVRQAQALVESAELTTLPDEAAQFTGLSKAERAELEALVAELNQLAANLHKIVPDYAPPPYTPSGMSDLLRNNLDRFTPERVKDLREILDGLTVDDFRDVETWKGMWFTLNYLVRLEANERTKGLRARLGELPGVSTLQDLREMLADTPRQEFLNPQTWKGALFVAKYEAENLAQGVKRRVFGEGEEG
ncbi:MAG: helix-hairpin-helix domain-containing protein [Chloroflexi bacterium]|nr:helix-hairpin-helix domain-containing protein [Chloroflexota bacterium]